MNTAADYLGQFMIGYTNVWTPNLVVAYTSVGVFEMFVVSAVFGVVLSDCLLILAPRDGSGTIAKKLVDFVLRAMLYTLQGLVSVSHALLLALLWVTPIERPELSESQKFFNQTTEAIGIPLTLFYVGLVLLLALYVLWKLWSGADAGLQNIAPWLLKKHGIEISEIKAGNAFPCAFVCAFFGIWPQRVLDALEIEQRVRNFRMEEDEVMLATVNALSFPLYIVPYAGMVAKLGEYMNQCPIYVAGRGFRWTSLFLSLTYAAEWVLIMCTCSELLESAERGAPGAEDAVANAEEGWVFTVSMCWLALALVRAVLASIRSHCQRKQCITQDIEDPKAPPPQAGSTASLEQVSCSSSEA